MSEVDFVKLAADGGGLAALAFAVWRFGERISGAVYELAKGLHELSGKVDAALKLRGE